MPVINRIAALQPEIAAWRHDFHAHPELQFDVHRTAAGMFTISYTLAVIIPTLSGALWDASGIPWMAFVPLAVCAVSLTSLGVVLSRHRPAA